MIPRAAVWQEFRRRALDTVPAGMHLVSTDPPTLRTWLRRGTFVVVGGTQGDYTLHASIDEIAGLFFSESALHLDHAAEHSTTIRQQIAGGGWCSSAWLVVTFYYWAYFLAVSVLRALGKSPWFLTKDEAQLLDNLRGVAVARSGSGPYTVNTGAPVSATQREIFVRRSRKGRLHDIVWRTWAEEMRGVSVAAGQAAGSNEEERVYRAVLKATKKLGDAWPSDLRNLVNYRPGFAYGAVRRMTPVSIFGAIEVDPGATFKKVVDRLEEHVECLDGSRPLEEQAGLAARVLVDQTFLMDEIGRGLHAEVVERRNLDGRWTRARTRFLEAQPEFRMKKEWPIRA